jgi:hypothetical protein
VWDQGKKEIMGIVVLSPRRWGDSQEWLDDRSARRTTEEGGDGSFLFSFNLVGSP